MRSIPLYDKLYYKPLYVCIRIALTPFQPRFKILASQAIALSSLTERDRVGEWDIRKRKKKEGGVKAVQLLVC